jgi:hypothetical protein
MSEPTELEKTEELFNFLQGETPESCKIDEAHVPNLTPEQAWTVIWYLGNKYWQVKDYIERCGVCGDLYNSEESGDCLDYGSAPYFFCGGCLDSTEYITKHKQDPDT